MTFLHLVLHFFKDILFNKIFRDEVKKILNNIRKRFNKRNKRIETISSTITVV